MGRWIETLFSGQGLQSANFPSFSPNFWSFSLNSLLLSQAVTQTMYLNCSYVRRAGGAQRILFKAQLLQRSYTCKKKLNRFDLVSLLNKSILGKEKTELALGTEVGEVRESPGPCGVGRGVTCKTHAPVRPS